VGYAILNDGLLNGNTSERRHTKMDEGRLYGYARVSTKEQNENRQLVALLECGVTEGNIFTDKLSGKDFHRPQYLMLMKTLMPGDTLFIKSIDRLGRDYEEIMNQWRIITKEKQIYVVVLDMPLLDTRLKDRDLTGVFIADIVLQILSYVAQTEREFIRQRQAEGIAVARAKGVHLGRPCYVRSEAFFELCKAWHNKETSSRLAARKLGISHPTFLLWAKKNPNT